MSKRGRIIPVVAVLGFIACSGQAADQTKASGESAALTEADVAAVKSVIDAYVATSMAQDWTAFGNTVTADIVAAVPNQAPIKGREAFVAFVKAFPKLTAFTVDNVEVMGRGDLAVATGNYHITMQMPDGTTAKDDGSFMEVHQKQADGTWPYTRLIWHSDLPVPTAAPAK